MKEPLGREKNDGREWIAQLSSSLHQRGHGEKRSWKCDVNQKFCQGGLCTICEGRVWSLQFTKHLENKTKKPDLISLPPSAVLPVFYKLWIDAAEDLAEGTHYFHLSNLPSCHNAFFGSDHSAYSFTFLNRNSTPTTFMRENGHLSQHLRE